MDKTIKSRIYSLVIENLRKKELMFISFTANFFGKHLHRNGKWIFFDKPQIESGRTWCRVQREITKDILPMR